MATRPCEGDPTVAAVWRRQTFSASIEACPPELAHAIISEFAPTLSRLIMPFDPPAITPQWQAIVDSAHAFGRMLHAAKVTGAGAGQGDAFYRCFVAEIGSAMVPMEIELVKRCVRSEQGQPDRVGATLFPGLVKITKSPEGQVLQTVVRRAQCICECALAWAPMQAGSPVSPRSFA